MNDSGRFVIGLTGSSGSGKSAAAMVLARLGAAVIDADGVARRVLAGVEALAELKEAFGDWVVDESGAYNRALVSKRAFSDRDFLSRLTEITHRHIIKEIYRLTDDYAARFRKCGVRGVIVIDAPLPVEKGFLDIADAVWVVRSPRPQRLERVMARDNLTEEDASARFSSQMGDDEYERLADVIIDNGGDVEALERQVELYYAQCTHR